MPAEGLRTWQARARASVFVAVVASATSGMIAVACCFSIIAMGALPSIDDVAYIVAMAKALMY